MPPVWRVSLTMTRPVVVLPEPDSPTRARTSPLRIARSIPSTARTKPGRSAAEAVEQAAPEREVDLEPGDPDELLAGGYPLRFDGHGSPPGLGGSTSP